MPPVIPAVELLARPDGGRVFTVGGRVRLGDVDRQGRLRLDATARFMQDAAADDASDARLDRRFGWLVRRTLIETTVPASLGEPITVSTWCSALGRAWAERRTQIIGERGAIINAVSLWIQVDAERGAPARVAADFIDAYGETSAGRTVSARLSLASPADAALQARAPWHVRRSDLDVYGHVNNAATWSMLEEAAELDNTARVGIAEIEYPRPLERGPDVDLVRAVSGDVTSAWLLSDDDVIASARWTAVSAA